MIDAKTLWAIMYGGRFITETFFVDVHPRTSIEVAYRPEGKYGLLIGVHHSVRYPLVARIAKLFGWLLRRGGEVHVEWICGELPFGNNALLRWFSQDEPLKIHIHNETRWKVRVDLSVMYIAFEKSVENIAKDFVDRVMKCGEVR